jgi:Domain found in Dishevelled, Egl-10, and Pleckstrin (DEP)
LRSFDKNIPHLPSAYQPEYTLTQANTPTAFICIATGDVRNAVRAAVMAMNVVPKDILPSRTDLQQLNQAMTGPSNTVAFIDLAAVRPAVAHMPALANMLSSTEARKRVILTRSDRGLWPADLAWARELGFAGMFAELDATALTSESHAALDLVAQFTWAASISNEMLNRHFSAMQTSPDTSSPRGIIRKATGLSAEVLCTALASSVKALDRTYHLRSYPSCFLGTEAVAWLSTQYKLTPDKAVALGAALQTLGMLHHVTHEQPFANTPNFFRTAVSTAAERLKPGPLLKQLTAKSGIAVKDRSYQGKVFPACFIGAEAVDFLHKHHKVSRHDAEIALNRLYNHGLIEHVTQEHAVRDEHFFYRFIA